MTKPRTRVDAKTNNDPNYYYTNYYHIIVTV